MEWSLTAHDSLTFGVQSPRIRNNNYTPKFLTIVIEASAVHLVVDMGNMHGS